MRLGFISILAILLFWGCQPERLHKKNSIAKEKVEYYLNIIKNYTNDINSDSCLKRIEAVSFLYKLSGIPSESSISDLGVLSPTVNDYQRWQNWYIQNKRNIYWNRKTQKVELRTD